MEEIDKLRVTRSEALAGWNIEFPDGGWAVVTDALLTDLGVSAEDYAAHLFERRVPQPQ